MIQNLNVKELKSKSKQLAWKLCESSLVGLVQHATFGTVNIDPEFVKKLRNAKKGIPVDRLSRYEEAKSAIHEFRGVLEQTIERLKIKETSTRLVILIDELDRCRPTYAVELLEIAKHIFSVPNVTFVLSTNISQLACSVNVLYGSEFNSKEYLKRFFDLDYHLPAPSRHRLIATTLTTVGIDSNRKLMPWSTSENIMRASMLDLFSLFFDGIALDYRTVDRVLRRMGFGVSRS